MFKKKIKIVLYTDPTSEEPVKEVGEGLSEAEITSIVGHDDWDYLASDVEATQTLDAKGRITAMASVVSVLAPLLLLAPAAFAGWQSTWPTMWVEIENGRYEVPLFPGKRKLFRRCYSIHAGNLQSEEPDAKTGECHEG